MSVSGIYVCLGHVCEYVCVLGEMLKPLSDDACGGLKLMSSVFLDCSRYYLMR